MESSIQTIVGAEQVFEPGEASDVSCKSEHLHTRIKQLLIESADAREKGHWKKAQELLFELRKMTRV